MLSFLLFLHMEMEFYVSAVKLGSFTVDFLFFFGCQKFGMLMNGLRATVFDLFRALSVFEKLVHGFRSMPLFDITELHSKAILGLMLLFLVSRNFAFMF